MSRRERASPGVIKAAAPAPQVKAGNHSAADQLAQAPRRPSWEDLYLSVSPTQQKELLGLAEKQGILYGDQLPRIPALSGNVIAPVLAQILQGSIASLEPVHAEPVSVIDQTLDDGQREAVAKALGTPDICIVRGLPGTGKKRLSVEIILQAITRGQRVLLLASNATTLDAILERLATREDILSVRCLDQGETAESLLPKIASMTFPARLSSANGKAQSAARARKTELERRWARLRQDEALWSKLEPISRSIDQLNESRHALELERAGLITALNQQVVNGEAPEALIGKIDELRRNRDEACENLDAALVKLKTEVATDGEHLHSLQTHVERLQALGAAKSSGRWWTLAWWQATLTSTWKQELADLEAGQQSLKIRIEEKEAQALGLSEERKAAERKFESENALLVVATVFPLQQKIDARLAENRRRLEKAEAEWKQIVSGLANQNLKPKSCSAADLEPARQAWRDELLQREKEVAFARQWAAHLENNADPIAARLHEYVNLVAGTPPAVEQDRRFCNSGMSVSFDLLLILDAEQLTEAEFVKAAGRARRWLFVGEPPPNPGRATTPRTQFLQVLWQRLHCDPRRLGYEWRRENDRLICRLHAISAADRRSLETERVADAPEVELRIVAKPGDQPILAEIAFPAHMSLDKAKRFVFMELDELAIRPGIQSLCWTEKSEHIILRLAERELPHGAAVPLESGIREMLGQSDQLATSCCLEFERAQGWSRSNAEEWVARRLGLRDLGRTVHLGRDSAP